MGSSQLGCWERFVQNRVLEKFEMEAQLQPQLCVLGTKVWGSSDEADVQGVNGEAVAECCLWILLRFSFPICEMGERCPYWRRATRLPLWQ